MTAYQRLTGLDASFLHLETADTPMHVGTVSVIEGGPFHDAQGRFRLDEVWRTVESSLHLVPRFRKRVVFVPLGQGRPVWVDDPTFDIANHVRLVELPPPGTIDQLRQLAARLHLQLLDRNHPLWELWFVDGVEGGRVGMIEKIHHAMVDGVSAVDVTTLTLSFSPEVGERVVEPWTPEPFPSGVRLVTDAVAERVTTPSEALRSARAVLRWPLRAASWAAETVDVLGSFTGAGVIAPGSSLNRGRVSRQRRLEVVHLPLSEAKRVKTALGGTVNDVILATVAGGFRHLLTGRGEQVDGLRLKALVPVSLRGADEHFTLGNRVAAMLAPLPIGIEDAAERLDHVRFDLGELKRHHQASVSTALLDLADHVPAGALAALSRLTHHQPFVNVVVTNVPGPQQPWYFMGARLLQIDPFVPLAGNLTVGIAIFSYDGTLSLGLHADSARCPDVAVLADGIEKSFAELQRLAA